MLEEMSVSHLPSLCWAWLALLERHLQNHNLQKRGIKLRVRNTRQEGGREGGEREKCEGDLGREMGKEKKTQTKPNRPFHQYLKCMREVRECG